MKNTKIFCVVVLLCGVPTGASASYRFADFTAHPPIHEYSGSASGLHAMTPESIKRAYRLPLSGGNGTIAIIAAYDSPHIENDLAEFDKKFKLNECTSDDGCFEKISEDAGAAPDAGWRMETALDVEWAHAIAPNAKILLVEAKTPSGANLIKAVDVARKRSDVVAISMSWGGPEFDGELALDEHFVSDHGAKFFAASGDDGSGVSWPAASANVIAVGGTRLLLSNSGSFKKETAWSGSGGGVSAYETQPPYQNILGIKGANGMRSVPDVSYNADMSTGYPVYVSDRVAGGWHVVGGTSAGSPQWAAIAALGSGVDHDSLYADKASETKAKKFFRDISSGTNGDCGYVCKARKMYDFVTGLGSPLTARF